MTRIIAAIVLAFAVTACAQPSTTPTVNTAALQQKVLEAETSYEVPLRLAIAYNQRPRCTVPPTVIVCSDVGVISQLRKANHNIITAFDAAMTVASTPGVSESAVVAAIAVATNLIPPLQKILDSYK